MHSLLLAALLWAHGLPDRGIFPELSATTSLSMPPALTPARPWLRLDAGHGVLTLYDGADALMAWPVLAPAGPAGPRLGDRPLVERGQPAAPPSALRVRAEDLPALLALPPATPVVASAPSRDEDHDRDGIVDRLDLLLGAKKLLDNRARYHEQYRRLPYPGGDVPRDEGVCTDTVVRALRNAGIDLQKEVHEDLLAAQRAYPEVRRPDSNIDHRRVKTLLVWFGRHFRRLAPEERSLPGDIVLLDTFPSRPGPDHIGILSDRASAGRLLVINNWTDGTTDAEMDLLGAVPATHRFRPVAPPPPSAASEDR